MSKHPIIQWINEEASSVIISRGKAYRGNVSKLKYNADEEKWTAMVHGTERYEVEIETLDDGNYYGECDCPYDMEDICKHIVAVAYEIAEERVVVTSSKSSVLATAKSQPVAVFDGNSFYESIFLNTSPTVQTAFLKQLFAQNEAIRTQFANYAAAELKRSPTAKVAATATTLVNTSKINVSELSAEIYEGLVDLEIDGDTYYEESDNYYDEGDGLSEWAEEIVDEFLSFYKKQINQYLAKQDLSAALAVLTAIHEAADGLPADAGNGNYGIFDSFTFVVLGLVQDEYKAVLGAIENTILSPNDKWKLLAQLLEIDLPSHFTYFEAILIALCNEKNTATKLLAHLENKKLLIAETAELALHCSQIAENPEQWLQLAKTLYTRQFSVATKLLGYYEEQKDAQAYHKTAEITIKTHGDANKMRLIEIIKDKLDYNVAPDFFLSSLTYYAEQKSDLAIYRKVVPYWTALEKEHFINNQKVKSDFYAQILTYEERFEHLLQFVESKVADYYGFYELLKYIGAKFPEGAFSIFKQRFFADEDRMKMDRTGYQRYCSNLRYLAQIEVPKEEKQVIVNRLRSIYAGRPAFLDELGKVARELGLK